MQRWSPLPRGAAGPGSTPRHGTGHTHLRGSAVASRPFADTRPLAIGPMGLASLTPTHCSAIGVQSAGVRAYASRDCCKAVVVIHNKGERCIGGGSETQLPIVISTCTSIQPEQDPPPVSAAMCAIALWRGRAGQQAVKYTSGHPHLRGSAIASRASGLAAGHLRMPAPWGVQLLPQHSAVPSDRSAQVCAPPAEIAVKVWLPKTAVGRRRSVVELSPSCPASLLPARISRRPSRPLPAVSTD